MSYKGPIIAERMELFGSNTPMIRFFRQEEGETPAEPIYPDLSQGPTEVPRYVLDSLIDEIDFDSLEPGENLYYVIPDELIEEKIKTPFAAFFGLLDPDLQRHVLDIDEIPEEKYEKPANSGKPANNNEPYPVDEKVHQLQAHFPRVKIPRVHRADPSSEYEDLIGYIIALSDHTERRLVQLENISSKSLHYLHRLSSRATINCMYYGGQSEYNKYKCIRCLHDDLVNDGQIMTLDQCLNCTRYEPIEGKCYEINNEQGMTLGRLYDNNQAAYMSMEDRFDLIRSERPFNYENSAKAFFDPAGVEEKQFGLKSFEELWDDGFRMDWDFTPAEKQTPDVHYWGGSEPSPRTHRFVHRSGSDLPRPPIGMGSLEETKAEAESLVESFKENSMIANSYCTPYGRHVVDYWNQSQQGAPGRVDAAINNMKKYGYEEVLIELSQEHGVDPSLIFAIISTESSGRVGITNSFGYTGLMQVPRGNLPSNWDSATSIEKARMEIDAGIKVYLQKRATLGSRTSLMLEVISYNAGEGMILGVSNNDKANHIADKNPDLTREGMPDWKWEQIAACVLDNSVKFYGHWKEAEVGTFFPRVIHAYQYIVSYEGDGLFDIPGQGIYFPVPKQHLNYLHFTSPYGPRNLSISSGHHNGIDIATGRRSGIPTIAMLDGTVSVARYSSGYGNWVELTHANGLKTRYAHLARIDVRNGQHVKAGETLGIIGTTGNSSGIHLHFEIRENNKPVNPANTPYFSQLKPYEERTRPSGTAVALSLILREQNEFVGIA